MSLSSSGLGNRGDLSRSVSVNLVPVDGFAATLAAANTDTHSSVYLNNHGRMGEFVTAMTRPPPPPPMGTTVMVPGPVVETGGGVALSSDQTM
jgi:hypothetical protein